MHIIYHDDCYDGFTAAWVAKMAHTVAELHPAKHGGEVPFIPRGSEVYMIDFSYPRVVMQELSNRWNLRVLDHHKTAEAALEGMPNCVFDMNRSGAMLAWDEFFPDEVVTNLVRYVQDCDLYTWKLPYSREINAWIHSYERTLSNYTYMASALGSTKFGDCINSGAAILRAEEARVNEACAAARVLNVAGFDVPVVNASMLFGQVADRLCILYPYAQFTAYYFDRADGIRQWGLRSNNGFDVSAIAKLFGGGGHPAAAGFQTEQSASIHNLAGA